MELHQLDLAAVQLLTPPITTALVSGVTNFSAFVISQIVPPRLNLQPLTNGFAFQFTPVPNAAQFWNVPPIWSLGRRSSPTRRRVRAPLVWQDPNAPADKAFYRLRWTFPEPMTGEPDG